MANGDYTIAMNPRNPDTDRPEDPFRTKVRDILGLSWDTRDDKIFDKLRELKASQTSQLISSYSNSAVEHDVILNRNGV